MQTKLLYLEDSYQKEMDAKILDVKPLDQNKYQILLDQTVFYALGGGQPFDQGKLIGENWQGSVIEVLLKDGELWHYVKSQSAPQKEMIVHGVIDWDRRYKWMKIHSGGHIVDFAMYSLGYSPDTLKPLKADHGKHPFIVYEGLLDKDISQELEQKAQELVEKDLQFSWVFQPLEDLQKEAIYLQPGLPTNKPLRTLRLEGIGAVADGGTQVHTTREVGHITITGIETQADQTIVKYSVA